MKLSRATTWVEARKLKRNNALKNFSVNEPCRNQLAAIASSGFRSMTQNTNLPPLSFTNAAPTAEINGGEVSATTRSKRPIPSSCSDELTKKVKKSMARRQRARFPSPEQGKRIISTPFRTSRRGSLISGRS